MNSLIYFLDSLYTRDNYAAAKNNFFFVFRLAGLTIAPVPRLTRALAWLLHQFPDLQELWLSYCTSSPTYKSSGLATEPVPRLTRILAWLLHQSPDLQELWLGYYTSSSTYKNSGMTIAPVPRLTRTLAWLLHHFQQQQNWFSSEETHKSDTFF